MLPRGLNGKSGLEGLQVQVWAVRLEASEQRFSDCSSWLSPDETARAARFHFEEHRRAFVLGRGVLRAILGGILETPPGQILFSYGPKGKPGLADPNSPLRFNVSNSGDLAVFCLAEGCDIGIDVEQVRPIPDMDRIAARFFAPEEASELMGLPEADRPRGFFNCWTRKEAYIKAVGDGLSVPLDSFQVTLRPGVPAEIVRLGGSEEAAKGWTLQEFAPAADYVGALAYRGFQRPVAMESLLSASQLLERFD